MSRIFTFGCSFTQYMWPTWATVIAFDRKKPLFNFGIAGLGNVGIFHRILEADIKHKFQPDDEIYILWSSWSREDRIKDGSWLPAGSVFNSSNPHYYGYFLRKYWDIDNDIVKNATAIISTNKMYKHLIKWQASAFTFFTNEAYSTKVHDSTKFLIDIYSKELPVLDVIECEKQGRQYDILQDSHPNIIEHVDIVENYIYPSLNLQLNADTKNYFKDLDNRVYHLINSNNITELDVLGPVLDEYLQKNFKHVFDEMNHHGLW